MSKVLAAMSGGVDSSVCAALLQRMGHDVIGVTMMLSGETEVASAESACKALGIEFHAVDMRKEFDENVVSPFVASYLGGETPNPCINCNKALKFGALFDLADKLGCEFLATGHYVKKTGSPGNWSISAAQDEKKDQSYVLYNLTQSQLDRLLFPLGDLSKQEVREIAESLGLEAAHKSESQDICFIPDGDYAGFITRYTGNKLEPGDFIDSTGNVIGRHKGVAAYTIGQRRGLDLPMGQRVYVIGKDAKNGTVTVGTEAELMTDTVLVRDVVFTSGVTPTKPVSVTARLRYSQKPQPAELSFDGKYATLKFPTPQRAPAPGQAAVFYVGDTVLGGGTITVNS